MRPFYTPHQLRHDQDDILFINEHWGEIKEAYFQVLEALKAPTIETPDSGCKCPWVKKTLIPTYFYITLDSTAEGLTDSDVEEIIKNTEVTVLCDELLRGQGAEIPKQFPLIYLGKTAEGYKYAFPYSLDDTRNDSTGYDTGHEKSILIQLHNRLSQYNTENSSYMHGLTKTNGTLIYRNSYGVGGKWPATNKIILSLAADDYTIYRDLDSERIPQDTAKVYYYKHIDNKIEPVPMTFEFLETVRQCTTEVGDKPEETPKPPTPETPDYSTPVGVVEGVLTPYTLKVRFKDTWYRDPGKFCLYSYRLPKLKEATKIVGDVVYFIFTEEEVLNLNGVDTVTYFEKHEPIKEPNGESMTYNTFSVILKFFDTIMDDVVNIEDINRYDSYVPIGSAYI